MNDEQLESCLRQWKHSSTEPVMVDLLLEEQMMSEMKTVRTSRNRLRRAAIILSVLFIGATGFLVAGGDAAVVNYVAPSTGVDEQGNPVPEYEAIWTSLLHHVHAHFRSFHGEHKE